MLIYAVQEAFTARATLGGTHNTIEVLRGGLCATGGKIDHKAVFMLREIALGYSC